MLEYYGVCAVHTALWQDLATSTGEACVHVNPAVMTGITARVQNTYQSQDIAWSKGLHTCTGERVRTHTYTHKKTKSQQLILTYKQSSDQFRVELIIRLN